MTALDLSLPMLQQARDRQAAHHYLLADIEAIPMTPKFLTWPGAIWRSSGAAIYAMR